MTKFVLVTGGVATGIGRTTTAFSVGMLLQSHGIRVTYIRFDPRLNIDSSRCSVKEHGEIFVLDDGTELDSAFADYENFLNLKLSSMHNITAGSVYAAVIEKAVRGEFDGQKVKLVPHMAKYLRRRILDVAKVPTDGAKSQPDVCIIELKGLIGDIQCATFVSALRLFKAHLRRENFMSIHICLLPKSSDTKINISPVQFSLQEYMKYGLNPDVLICRTRQAITDAIRRSLSSSCGLYMKRVLCVHDVHNVYKVAPMLEEQRLGEVIQQLLILENYKHGAPNVEVFKDLAFRLEHENFDVYIGIVAEHKYPDAYTCVFKALQHAALSCHRHVIVRLFDCNKLFHSNDVNRELRNCGGILIVGDYNETRLGGKIEVCKWARLNRVPMLAVSSGMYAVVVEFARSVLSLDDAASVAEKADTKHPVIIHDLESKETIRKGLQKTAFTASSIVRKLYGDPPYVEERHRSKYKVNTDYVDRMEQCGLIFVGRGVNNSRADIAELREHPFYVAADFHPEYLSAGLRPSPLYVGLILAASRQLKEAMAVMPFPINPHIMY